MIPLSLKEKAPSQGHAFAQSPPQLAHSPGLSLPHSAAPQSTGRGHCRNPPFPSLLTLPSALRAVTWMLAARNQKDVASKKGETLNKTTAVFKGQERTHALTGLEVKKIRHMHTIPTQSLIVLRLQTPPSLLLDKVSLSWKR